MAIEEEVTFINNGGTAALGIVTNLVVSGYAQFGDNRGSLFSPEGYLQISGDFVTYRNLMARGGLYVGDLAASSYRYGAFIRGLYPSGDPTIDGSKADFYFPGSGTMGAIELDSIKSARVLIAHTDLGAQYVFTTTGSGLMQGPLELEARADFPTDLVTSSMPVYVGITPGNSNIGGQRLMASGEIAAGASYQLDAQTTVVGVENTASATPMYSYQIPSGHLGIRGGVEVQFYGHYLNATLVPRDFTVRIDYAGTSWLTGSLTTITNNAGARALSGRVRINAAGSTSAQRGVLTYALDVPSTASGTGTSSAVGGFGVTVTNPYVAVHTNAPPQELTINFQHSTNDPDLRAFVYNVTTRKL